MYFAKRIMKGRYDTHNKDEQHCYIRYYDNKLVDTQHKQHPA